MSDKSSHQNLVEEDSTPPSSPHGIVPGLKSSDDAAVEEAWQEKVQRDGIRLEDEPYYMTSPEAIKCRKKLAYCEKMARESQDPNEAQKAQNLVEWGDLMQKQIMYSGSGERERIGPEAARAREEQFVREMEVLSRRILSAQNHTTTTKEAGEDNAGDGDAPKKKRYKGKKRAQKTQPGSSTEPAIPSCKKSSSREELALKRARHQPLQPPHEDWSLIVPLRQFNVLLRASVLSQLERKK